MTLSPQDLPGTSPQRQLQIDLDAVAENIARFRRASGGRSRVMAVLKAMAYGTDLVQLGVRLSQLGMDRIGVSATQEGAALRSAGVTGDIFVFLPDVGDINALAELALTPLIYSTALAEAFIGALSGRGKSIDVHLKVDTGMHRLGVAPEAALATARAIRASGVLRLSGVCTHFAAAEDPAADARTRSQIAVFEAVLADLRADGFTDLEVHAANTAASMRFPEAHYDTLRVGLGLYGVYPSPACEAALPLQLAIAVTSRIASLQHRKPGDSLGYGHSFVAARDMVAAAVPFGYDDGMPWHHSGDRFAIVAGQRVPIVGRISMDQLQLDVTDLPGVAAGDEVVLIGGRGAEVIRPEAVADAADTIGHELLTRIGPRVQRVYLKDGRVIR